MHTKKHLFLFSALLSCAPLHAQTPLNDQIWQTLYYKDAEPVTISINIDGPVAGKEASGTLGSGSIKELGSEGAKFELFAMNHEGTELIAEPIDSKLTGTYLPKAAITLESQDPYNAGVPRTRADEPYYARIDIEGLLSDETAPDSAKRVYVERLFAAYTSDNRLPIDGSANYTIVDAADKGEPYTPSAFYVSKNASIEGEFTTAMDEASQTEWFKQKGEELIRVYALPSESSEWEVIAEEKIQVWPVASAVISTFLNGAELDTSQHINTNSVYELNASGVPTFVINLSDLYPTSSTYAIIYKGEYQSNGSTAAQTSNIVASDYDSLNFNTVTPQSATLTLTNDDWISAQKGNVVYTLEVRTTTGFNSGEPETLAWIQFKPDLELAVKGSFTTSE